MTDPLETGDELESPLTLSGRVVAGRYSVVRQLGQGGIGKVYEAIQIGLDRRAAVKVIRSDKRSETTFKRFMREARAAGRISSPHVVTLFDCGTDPQTDELYIAMEMLSGESLSERLRRDPHVEIGEALHIGASIARGLSAAHAASVLHRDLKPGNVFLCSDGIVKVLDFGIAKLTRDEPLTDVPVTADPESLTQADRLLGTPAYMSPETALRRPQGPATDLYALGVMLWEMVVGRPLFKLGNTMKTLIAHVKTPAPLLSEATDRDVPLELEELVASLLEKDPEVRPSDAGEVAIRLTRLASQVDLEASIDTSQDEYGERTIVDLPTHASSPELPDKARWGIDDTGENAMTTQWVRPEDERGAPSEAPTLPSASSASKRPARRTSGPPLPLLIALSVAAVIAVVLATAALTIFFR